MLQDSALCLASRQVCPRGGCEDARTPSPVPFRHLPTHPHDPRLLLRGITQSPNASRLLLVRLGAVCVTGTEMFSRKQKTSQISPSLPPDAFGSQPDSLTEPHTLKSDANLPAAETPD